MLVQKGISTFSDRIPKVISPKAHAIADYAAIGGLMVMAAVLWKRHRRAAIAAAICAGGEAANTLLTDYPGGVAGVLSFHAHGNIDAGLGATASALPNFLQFANQPEAKFFRIMGLSITLIREMTEFKAPRRRPYLTKSA